MGKVKKMIKPILAAVFLSVLFIGSWVVLASADSLWQSGQNSPYSPPRAHKVGDVVTIIIEETTAASHKADLKTNREAKTKTDLTALWQSVGAVLGKTTGQADIKGKNEFTGKGETSRSSSVRATITAGIKAIRSNGNCEIYGEHRVKVNEEEEEIKISGVIRPGDIAPDNSIRSSQIAEAQISIQGNGPVGQQQSPGFLTKILNWLF